MMSTTELKQQIFKAIENMNDNEFLMVIKEFIDLKSTSVASPSLSEWQINRIRESEKQIDSGNFLTDNQVINSSTNGSKNSLIKECCCRQV